MPMIYGGTTYPEYGIFFVGDSKTAGSNVPLYTLYEMRDRDRGKFLEEPTRMAVAGTGASYWASHVDAELAARTYIPMYICLNLGVNDVNGDSADVGDGTQWKINMAYVLDALHAYAPNAPVYQALVWKGGGQFQDKLNLIDDVLIPELKATRPWMHIAYDERIIIKSNDNGATYLLPDAIHYSEAGNLLIAQAWFDILTADE